MGLYAEIREIMSKSLAVEEAEILPDARLEEDLGVDSLGTISLAEAIAAQYDIDIGGEDVLEIDNVSELVKLVESRVGSRP